MLGVDGVFRVICNVTVCSGWSVCSEVMLRSVSGERPLCALGARRAHAFIGVYRVVCELKVCSGCLVCSKFAVFFRELVCVFVSLSVFWRLTVFVHTGLPVCFDVSEFDV